MSNSAASSPSSQEEGLNDYGNDRRSNITSKEGKDDTAATKKDSPLERRATLKSSRDAFRHVCHHAAEVPCAFTDEEAERLMNSKVLSRFSVVYFAWPLGWIAIANQARVLNQNENIFAVGEVPEEFWLVLWWASLGFYLFFVGVFIVKLVKYPRVVFCLEFRDPDRLGLCYAPFLCALLLTISVPTHLQNETGLRIIFCIFTIIYFISVITIYSTWFYGADAAPTLVFAKDRLSNLMLTVGWFMLAQVGVAAGLDIWARWSLYTGMSIWILVVIHLLSMMPGIKPTPLMWLMIAPPSVASIAFVAVDGADEDGNGIALALLYFAILFYLMLLRPLYTIVFKQEFNAGHLAFTFPIVSVSSAWLIVVQANGLSTSGTRIVSFILSIIGVITVLAVTFRLLFKACRCGLHAIIMDNLVEGVCERYCSKA
eukprot:Clim_evm1s152 gene=Clim_evmTU1s152